MRSRSACQRRAPGIALVFGAEGDIAGFDSHEKNSDLLKGLDRRLTQETKFPVYVADDPLTCVVRGAGEVLEEARMLAKVHAETTESHGYGFQIEMTTRARALGARIVEVPIVFRERETGTSKMSAHIAIEALRGVPAMRRILR